MTVGQISEAYAWPGPPAARTGAVRPGALP